MKHLHDLHVLILGLGAPGLAMAPKPSVTHSTIQTKRLARSNHSTVENAMAKRISTPPMVGVPLLERWVSMP